MGSWDHARQAVYPSLHNDRWKPSLDDVLYRECMIRLLQKYMLQVWYCLSSDLIADDMTFIPLLCSAAERYQSPSIHKIQQTRRSTRKSRQLVLRGSYSTAEALNWYIYSPFLQNSQLEWRNGFLFTVNLVAKVEALVNGVCTLL